MRLQRITVEGGRGQRDASGLLQEARQFAFDRIRRRLRPGLGKGAREVRGRNEIAAQQLRQCPDQRRCLVGDETRRQPAQARGVECIEQMQRHQNCHAVVDRAWLETVLHGQPRLAQCQVGREPRCVRGIADQ